MDFNQILPENFFNLFQSKHRSLYIESLIRIYKKYETSSILGMPKDIARDVVEDLLLEKNIGLNDLNDENEYQDDIPNIHEQANYFLRRLEQTGWILIDVNNDYEEVLNFNDYAITLILAFIEIEKDSTYSLFADNFTFDNEEKAFKGYIFTIYSLLNSDSYDYGLILNQVYKNTISFVREIRKVDHKLREFIQMIDKKEEIKDLVELLSQYKDEVMDKAYFKLKTFDNINKYKLDIIKKLEHMQENPDIMAIIANDYMFLCSNDSSLAQYTATKQINDCIDIYNSIESIMDEIDKKNRDYITQTLAKVKYLLNDSTDVLGELNQIVKHYTKKVQDGKSESGFNDIKSLFNINTLKYMGVSSLSTPRGNYKKTEQNFITKTRLDFSSFKDSFVTAYKSLYTESDIEKELESVLNKGETKDISAFVKKDVDKDGIIKLILTVIYASSFKNYIVREQLDYYETDNFIIKNFTITRGDK